MSKADELIAGLATDAQFDSDGSFSLDREKAREKMRQFQLADPHRYVLLLVEAAVLRGATTIVFDIDADDMQMRFDAALSWADLDELYGALFINRTTDEIRARRELALACNAVMALNPRWVRIESFTRAEEGGGAGAAQGMLSGIGAELRSDSKDEITKLDKPTREFEDMPHTWTSIHVKERFRPGLLVRFLRDMGGSIPEEQLLRSRCQHAATSITLDGVRISEGLPSNLVCARTFELEHIRGVAGIDLERRDLSGVVLLSNGVQINTHELGESIHGLWYWVDSSRFRKDVSQGDVVRGDPAYEAMLRALARGRDLVLGTLAERWHAGGFNEDSQPSLNEVFDLLRDCFVRWADVNWLGSNAGSLGQLARMPLWRTVDRSWLSPVALLEQADATRGLMYTERDFDGVVPQGWGPIIHVLDGEAEIAAIKRVHPQAESVTARLEREVPWEQARRKWRARPHALELPQGAVAHPIAFEQGEYRGRVAIRPSQLSNISVIVDGCLLCELEVDLGVVGLWAAIAGPLTPAADYTRPRTDRDYASLLLLLLTQLPTLIEALADSWQVEHSGGQLEASVRRYLLAATRDDFATRYLVAFGFTDVAAKQMLERLGTPELMPSLGLGDKELSSAVARLISFPTVDGRRVTLDAIDFVRRERARVPGKVLLVDRSAPRSTGIAELLLHADADDRRLLALVFGAEALHDDTHSYVREIGRREFEAKPERQPSPPLTTWTVAVTLEHGQDGQDRITGHVGINAPKVGEWQPTTPRRMSIELFTRNRSLCRLEEQSWVPGVEASLAWEGALLNADCNGIEGSHRPLIDAVERGLIQILSTRAQTKRRPAEDERRLLWLAIVSPFLSVEHFRAWRALRAHFAEHSAAVTAYSEVMELFPGVPLADIREAIKLLLDDGKLPDRATLLSLLGRDVAPPGGGRDFQRAVLGIFALLETVPLLESVGRTQLDLAQVTAALEQTGHLAYVEDRTLTWDGAEDANARVIVRADEIDKVALIRLFGRETFSEVTAWIHERRNQQRFESRARIEHLRVPDSLRLVGVEFERDGFSGELAIPERTIGEEDSGVTRITFCHDRRVIQEIELHAALPVIGIIDDAQAELTADYTKVDPSTARMAALRKLIDEVLANELLPRLAEQYEQLDPRKRSIAHTWIASHWRRSSMRAGQHPNRLTVAGKLFAQLKLFRDTDQEPCSLADLIGRFEQQRQVWYVDRHPGHSIAPPFPIVEARGDQLALLRDMFPLVEDFSDRWRACVAGERRKQAAKPLPPLEVPSDALISITLQRNELSGALWIPLRYPFGGAVTLGAEGKLVEVREFVEALPVLGVVGGELRADDAFETVLLSGAQRRYLETQIVALYSSLLNAHEHELARPDKVDFLDSLLAQHRVVRLDILRAAAIALRRAELAGEGADAILGNLQKRLYKTALLRLNTGRLINLDVASKARPQELAYLGIWDLEGPVLDTAERARILLGDDAPAPAQPVVSVEPQTPPPAAEPKPEPEPAEPPPDEMDLGLSLLAGMMNGAASPSREKLDELAKLEAQLERMMGGSNDPLEPAAPTPTPKPEPAPVQPPPRDPVADLLDRIRDELRLLRERHELTLGEGLLDGIHAESRNGKTLVVVDDRVVFDSAHPRFLRALVDPDPIWVSFLASVAYTALNHWLEEVSDDDELEFHAAHATFLLSALLDGSAVLDGTPS